MIRTSSLGLWHVKPLLILLNYFSSFFPLLLFEFLMWGLIVWATLYGAQRLVLALCSGLTSDSPQDEMWGI